MEAIIKELKVFQEISSKNDDVCKPEPLKGNLTVFWSRRIDDTNKLVYAVDDGAITIISCLN